MARQLSGRLRVTGELVSTSPIHIGGADSSATVDLMLAVNGQGQYYVPGTSLAGALRNGLQTDETLCNALWGYQTQDSQQQDNLGQASYVMIDDAPITGEIAEIREGVGIDREWGSAAEAVKFNRAILPKGTRIPLSLTVEQPATTHTSDTTWADMQPLLLNTLVALQQEQIRIGAAKTRGLGRVRLENIRTTQQDFSSFDGILDALAGQDTSTEWVPPDVSPVSSIAPQTLNIEIQWRPVGPVMSKADAAGITVDILPLTSTFEGQQRFVLPGSAIKGALRTQAERILRTLLGQSVESGRNNPKQRFLSQLQGLPLVTDLFGGVSQQGTLTVEDCYTQCEIELEQWLAVSAATSEITLRQALNAAGLAQVQQAFHVSIDRWTGAAADQQLYSTLELFGIDWEPMQLHLDFVQRVSDAPPIEARIALLLLVLRDLARTTIPLGYGTNRGMGAIAIDSICCTGAVPERWQPLLSTPIFSTDETCLLLQASEFLHELNQQWQQWLTTQRGGTQ